MQYRSHDIDIPVISVPQITENYLKRTVQDTWWLKTFPQSGDCLLVPPPDYRTEFAGSNSGLATRTTVPPLDPPPLLDVSSTTVTPARPNKLERLNQIFSKFQSPVVTLTQELNQSKTPEPYDPVWLRPDKTKGWGRENVSRMILYCFYISQKASDLQKLYVYTPV